MLLLGLLAAVGVAYLGTGSLRARLWAESRATRRDVGNVEARLKEQRQVEQRRVDRTLFLERLAADPLNFDLLMRVGALYGQEGRYEDALFLYHEARRVRPERAEPYRALQEAYISTRQYDRAYDACSAGLKRVPDDVELTLGLVHLDTLVGWNVHARRVLQSLERSTHGELPRVLIASALVYRQVADSRRAEEKLRAAAAKDSRNSKIYALLSGVQWETGNAEGAEAHIRQALELEPQNAEYLIHLADMERAKRTPEGFAACIRLSEQALEVSPSNKYAFMAIAEALLDQKKKERARKILEELNRRHPDYAKAALELGKIYVREGKPEEGQRLMESYTSGVRAQGDLKGAYLKVGMQYDHAAPHVSLGKVLTDSDEPEKAILVLRHALALQPDNQEARRQLGRALEAVGRGGEFGELVKRPDWRLIEVMDQGAR